MYLVFHSTNDVFKAEEIFLQNKIPYKMVPAPVVSKVYCNVSIRLEENTDLSLIESFTYEVISDSVSS